MYHLQLRHFPHNAWRFNLSREEVSELLAPWAHDKTIELGERRWSPERATLTVLEGPELPLQDLSMGRGWRAAERRSRDVTEELVESLSQELSHTPGAPLSAPAAAPAGGGGPEGGSGASERGGGASGPGASLGGAAPARTPDLLAAGVMLASLLGEDALSLLERWRAVSAADPQLAPSEALRRAERPPSSPSEG